jgi:hypothetical protein
MSRVISVITAAHLPSVPYLLDAYESLIAQKLPAGWCWEWLLQEDGRTGAVAAAVPTIYGSASDQPVPAARA